MKILIAADLYWPTLNGVATASRSLAKGLAARGHEVVVIAPSQVGKKHRERDGDYLIERTTSLPFPFYQNFRISLTPQREIKKIISKFQPDVIHIQMVMGIGRATLQTGSKLDVPIVSTNHAMPENLLDNIRMLAPFAKPINTMLESYGARFHSSADYVTTPTQSAIDMFAHKMKDMEVPVEAVSNGIDLSVFSPDTPSQKLYTKYRLPTDRPVLLYVGRLDAEKHLSVLIQAAAKVIQKIDAHLLIVGQGNERSRLGELARGLGIEHKITFTGKVSNEDLPQIYRIGTVFCMPSPAELQSIVMLEAMATGSPVVAVNAGALAELCHDGKNGYLFKYDDDSMMAAAIVKILTNPKLRAKMLKESLAIAKTHDINYTLDRFEAIYKKLIKDKKAN
ncbi:MAG: glycosyltransferase [Patescibacteria group bacterium]